MKRPRILVVDDDPGVRRLCADTLERLGKFDVQSEGSSERAAERLTKEQERFDLLLTDVRMPVLDGIGLLRKVREHDPDLQVLVLTGYPTVESAVEAMKLGAADYVTKPFHPEDLVATCKRLLETGRLREENRVLSRQVERPYVFDDIIGASPGMQRVFKLIKQVADSNVDVLVLGETGTGKEAIARSLHQRSRRNKERFVPVNAGAIPENLMESEFFGHEKGAFTGADQRSVGLLEFADKGTFFLDEVGELPLTLQAKLLRTLQERRIRRVGGKEEMPIDVRIVAATAADLDGLVKQRRFREDLYFRINVLRIELPPLRERGEDILHLAEHFVARYAREAGKQVTGLSPEVREVFAQYRWPGNVRELQNAVRRAIAVAQNDLIGLDDLPDAVVVGAGSSAGKSGGGGAKGTFFQAREERMASFEREYLTALLEQHQGDVAAAAVQAEIPRGTYYRLMKKFGLNASDFR